MRRVGARTRNARRDCPGDRSKMYRNANERADCERESESKRHHSKAVEHVILVVNRASRYEQCADQWLSGSDDRGSLGAEVYCWVGSARVCLRHPCGACAVRLQVIIRYNSFPAVRRLPLRTYEVETTEICVTSLTRRGALSHGPIPRESMTLMPINSVTISPQRKVYGYTDDAGLRLI